MKVAVVGAGPIGLTLSLVLRKIGFQVGIYEKWSFEQFMCPPDDTRVLGTTFTCRGLQAIRMAGLEEAHGV